MQSKRRKNEKMTKKTIIVICLLSGLVLGICWFLFGTEKIVEHEPEIEEESDVMEITLGVWDAMELLQDDELQRELEEKFQVIFIPIEINYSNWVDEYQKLAALDQLPDIMSHNLIGTVTYQTWITQNLITMIPKDLKGYPNLQAYMGQDYIANYMNSDGEHWSIPRMGYDSQEGWILDRAIIVRKDWREELEIPPIRSVEELASLSQEFQKGDLDGNGLLDTRGIEINNMYKAEGLYLPDYPLVSNTERGWIEGDERLEPAYLSSDVGEALNLTQQLYREGAINESFFFQYAEESFSNFLGEKSGILIADFPKLAYQWIEKYPDRKLEDYIEIVDPWVSEDGNRYRFTTTLHWSELYLCGGMEEEKLEKILEIFDYLLSEEFKIKLENPEVQKMPSSRFFNQLVDWNMGDFYTNEGWYKDQFPESTHEFLESELKWYEENTIPVPYNFEPIYVSEDEVSLMPNIELIYDIMVECILSEDLASEKWGEEIEEFRDAIELDAVIDGINQKIGEDESSE